MSGTVLLTRSNPVAVGIMVPRWEATQGTH